MNKFNNIKVIARFLRTGLIFSYLIFLNKVSASIKLFPFKHLINNMRIKRIKRDSYMISSLIGYLSTKMLNRNLSSKEYENLYLAGAITPLYDRFFDNLKYSEEFLQKITLIPESIGTDNPFNLCFVQLYQKLISNVFNYDDFRQSSLKVYEAQLRSRKQQTSISTDEIENITYEKGGASSIFYESVLKTQLGFEQKELMFWFGAFIQLLDDIFDLHCDLINNHNTLITRNLHSIGNIKVILQKLLFHNIDLLNDSEITEKNKTKLVNFYYFFAFPGLSYIDYLYRSSLYDKLINEQGQLKEKYCWKSWNIRKLIMTLYYIIQN